MSSIKAILFDFDGTLANSEQNHFEVWNIVLAECGEAPLDEYTYTHGLAGLPVPEAARHVKEHLSLTVPLEEIVRRKNIETGRYFTEHPVDMMPFAKEILTLCRDRGLKLALVTASSRSELAPTFKHHELAPFFDAVVTRDDVERSKPFPDSYQLGMERLGVTAAESLAVEDTSHGVQAAHSADIPVAAVPNEHSRSGDFSAATVVIDDGLKGVWRWIEAQL
ncbi:HAD family hydrolase [Zymobacter palmae]|uniref:Predicted phosphatase/phosphohexomutase n=1 Tax=Zymobacter palmae TaxID=33074 RepID=A0A348HHF1_9GAMM|nr:HAD family phosphatase [Zymobacter palmae]BBG31053.1 predicted phosphatase/phosphohexomutase [Zymobacter palmae]